ncbi:MAG: archaemetzincin [Chloroflexi bacterium]|nr:archaemetzincin [Chloroflexota bacterium]
MIGRHVIYILPMGSIEQDMLDRLSICLEERFLSRFKVLPEVSLPIPAQHLPRNKYFSNLIFDRMRKSFPPDGKFLLGVTDLDLLFLSPSSIYAESNIGERMALISIAKLKPEYYGALPNQELLFNRMLKECTHELGHLLGFHHCLRGNCAMYFSRSILDTDHKGNIFCAECERRHSRITRNL